MKNNHKDRDSGWASKASLLISGLAFFLSAASFSWTYQDSYLSHRAYLTITAPGLSDDSSRMQMKIINAGQTPATDVSAHGRFVIGARNGQDQDLTSGNTIAAFPGTSAEWLVWVCEPSELKALQSSQNNEAVVTIRYRDYRGKDRSTVTRLVFVPSANGAWQIHEVGQTLD